MDISEIFHAPDNKMWRIIREKYKEDPNQIEELIEKFKNWLKSKPHLPTDINEHFIRNFIRYQESDLEKSKETFERYLVSTTRAKSLMQNRDVTKKDFRDMIYKFLTISKDLTPEGYRIAMLKIPAHIDNVDFEEMFHFVLVWAHLVLSLDSCAGYIAVYFLEDVSVDLADKINVELLKEVFNMCFNIAPFRVINLHLVNGPEVPKTIQSTLESFVKPEFMEKVYVHKDPTTLKEYLPEDMIPQKYGGTLDNIDELVDNMKTFLDRNKGWTYGFLGLKPTEPFQDDKSTLYDPENLEKDANINPPFID